jgi:hypothetical protein
MCQSGTTCLHADCCFSKLVLYKSSPSGWSSTKEDIIKLVSRNDIFEKNSIFE